MKNLLKKAVIFAVAGIMALSVEAQEEKGVQFTVSGDFVSSYVWRGIYQGSHALQQPPWKKVVKSILQKCPAVQRRAAGRELSL